MREIKFRAKIKAHDFEQKLALINKPQNEGEWAYGEIHVNSKIPHIHVGPYRYPIDIETIGQYTGMKDANGKDLYEGDIISCFCGVMHHVKYEGAAFRCYLKGERYGFCISQEWLTELEKVIIGNIYDNPELVEQ